MNIVDKHFVYMDPSLFVNHSQSHKLTSCEIECENTCIRNPVVAQVVPFYVVLEFFMNKVVQNPNIVLVYKEVWT